MIEPNRAQTSALLTIICTAAFRVPHRSRSCIDAQLLLVVRVAESAAGHLPVILAKRSLPPVYPRLFSRSSHGGSGSTQSSRV